MVKSLVATLTEKRKPVPMPLESFFTKLVTNYEGNIGVSQPTLAPYSPRLAEIAGRHRGNLPNIAGLLNIDEIVGGKSWQKQREILIE